MGQLIVAAAGAAVGFAVGGPQGAAIGWSLGSMLGAPQQKMQGPRLHDLKVTGTEYGNPIAYIEGTVGISCELAWASDLTETATETEAGKGGGASQTTYTYSVNLLFVICDNKIAGVSRIWYDGELVYNSLASGDIGTTIAAASNDLWDSFTVYTGDDDKLPHPTYETAVGTANALAYIGSGSIAFDNLQLGNSGRIGNFKFEVISAGAVTDQGGSEAVSDVSTVFQELPIPIPIAFYQPAVYEKTAWLCYNVSAGSLTYYFLKSKNYGRFKFKRTVTPPARNSHFEPVWATTNGSPRMLYFTFIGASVTDGTVFESIDPETGAVSSVATTIPAGDSEVYIPVARKVAYDEVQDVWVWGNTGYNSVADPDAPVIVSGVTVTIGASIPGLISLAAWDGHIYALCYSSSHWRVRRYDYTGTFVDQVEDTADNFDYGGLSVATNDMRAWIRVDKDGVVWVLSSYRGRLWKITTEFEEVSTPTNVEFYGSDDLSGVYYCTENFAAWGLEEVTASPNATDLDFYLRKFKARSVVTASTVAGVVERLLLRCGLRADQFDVTDLESISTPIRGLSVSQVTPARQVLEMLGQMYDFSCVLRDKLYLKRKPTTSVATLDYDVLGADDSEGSDVEPLQLDFINQLEDASQIALSYINANGDYITATEYSDILTSDQNSVSTTQVPICFTETEAKKIADGLVTEKATAKIRTTISLTNEYLKLEPYDLVAVDTAAGDQLLFRLNKREDNGTVLKYEAILHDVNARVSSGITDLGYEETSSVGAPIDTELLIKDVPILRDADDELGVYAVCHANGEASPGAQLFKSPDDVTFVVRQSVTETASVGIVTSALTTWARGNVFDHTSRVTVEMFSGTLSSYTRAQILSGIAPIYLIGTEYVYAMNATLVGVDTYQLSGFLRGRKGTDWAMSGHAIGEDFVVFSTRGIRRERFDTSELSATRYFRAVTFGRKVSTAESESITFAGVGKMPYSPCNLRAERIAAGTSDDPNFGNVVLLLHGEGTNLAQVITDNSTYGRTATVSGNTQTRTAQFKFGTSSMYFDGTGDYLTYTSIPSITGDFVLDLHFRPDSVTGGVGRVIFDNRTSAGDANGFALFGFGTGLNVYSNNTTVMSTGSILAAATWTYVRMRRVSGVIYLETDGVLRDTWTTSAAFSRARVVLGRDDPGANQYFIGYMDEVRLKIGDGEASRDISTPTAAYDHVVQDSATTLIWNRRTRLSKNFTTGLAPLGEDSEAYDVLIYSDSGFGTVLRTERVTEPQYVYSRADQIDDFGSFQTTLYVDVHQISALVGRGYKLRGTV